MGQNSNNSKILLELFLTFFKIGLFTFGGGYAMIPLIERELVDKKKWVEAKDIVDVFALSQTIPGAIAVNSSAFVGHKIAGKKGTFTAIAGVILPSFMIIILIAALFSQFQDIPIVQKAFLGIRAAIVGLILLAALNISKSALVDKLTITIAIATVLLIIFLQLHPAIIIIAGGLVGVLIYYFYPKKKLQIIGEEGQGDDLP